MLLLLSTSFVWFPLMSSCTYLYYIYQYTQKLYVLQSTSENLPQPLSSRQPTEFSSISGHIQVTLEMKGKHVFLDELRPTTKAYKVKVRVDEKGRAKTSLSKNLKYQNLVLKDDKGNRMKAALFGEQVDGFKDALQYNGVYEISNAPIKDLAAQWKTSPDELDYQMSFGRQTTITPIETELDASLPQYCAIANIPRSGDNDDKIDVLGIVLYVDPEPRKVTTTKAYDTFVREIVIADHSTEMPLVISAWNDLAAAASEDLCILAKTFSLVGFTALRPSSHKGFSMATTMSTVFITNPTGDRATALANWADQHQPALTTRQERVLVVRNPSGNPLPITIAVLRLKRATTVLLEDHFWLEVHIPDSGLDRVYTYVGCPICGKRTENPVGTMYDCSVCKKKACLSSDRVTFNCEIVDGTGSLPVTMFTTACETLFRKPAAEIVQIKQTGDNQTFSEIRELLKTTTTLVEVAPTTALAKSNILQWVPKTVILQETKGHQDSGKSNLLKEIPSQNTIVPATPQKKAAPPRRYNAAEGSPTTISPTPEDNATVTPAVDAGNKTTDTGGEAQ